MTFLPNQTIIAEGSSPQQAYIIISGHCKLQSNQIPIKKTITNDDPKKTDKFLTQNRGYFSTTMNTYQLGIISENQWIGEEILLMSMQERYEQLQSQINQEEETATNIGGGPGGAFTGVNSGQTMSRSQRGFNMNQTGAMAGVNASGKKKAKKKSKGMLYSVIAKTQVQAYFITKDDMITKLSKDIQQLINKQAVKKQEWIMRRFEEIQNNAKAVFGMEHTYQNYVDKSKEVVKKFPQATKYSLKTLNIHKLNEPIVFEKDIHTVTPAES